MRWLGTAVLAVGMALAVPAFAPAEIIKTTMVDNPKCDGLCLRYWPKLSVPEGWRQDSDLSQTYNVNFLVPKGKRSDVFIYANAQGTKGQAQTVAGFMADDRATFERTHSGMKVRPGPVFVTGDGQKLSSLIFDPGPQRAGGHWEIAAYGEEIDRDGSRYYLVFTLSAESEAVRNEHLPVFMTLMRNYHK